MARDVESTVQGATAVKPVERRVSAWRINHPPLAGGPTYVETEPTPATRAAFLTIGVTITEMFEGPLEPAAPEQQLLPILKERVRMAVTMLTSLEESALLKSHAHWRREIANIRQLVFDIAAHLGRSR